MPTKTKYRQGTHRNPTLFIHQHIFGLCHSLHTREHGKFAREFKRKSGKLFSLGFLFLPTAHKFDSFGTHAVQHPGENSRILLLNTITNFSLLPSARLSNIIVSNQKGWLATLRLEMMTLKRPVDDLRKTVSMLPWLPILMTNLCSTDYKLHDAEITC